MVLSRKSSGCPCSHTAMQQDSSPQQPEGSHHFTHEHIQQTFLHTLCYSTSWSQASQVQHQQHIRQQTSAHANSQFVPLLSTSAQGGRPHISETILSVFQGIVPNKTLAACPGSNSSRVKSCKFSHVWGSLVFALPLMRTQADCDSSLSCAISTVVDYSKEELCLSSTCLTWLTCSEDCICLHVTREQAELYHPLLQHL